MSPHLSAAPGRPKQAHAPSGGSALHEVFSKSGEAKSVGAP